MDKRAIIEKLEAIAKHYARTTDPIRVSFGTFDDARQLGEAEHVAPGRYELRLNRRLLDDLKEKLAEVYFHEIGHIREGHLPKFNQPAIDVSVEDLVNSGRYNHQPKEQEARAMGDELMRDFFSKNGLNPKFGEDFFHFLVNNPWTEQIERAAVHLSPDDNTVKSLMSRELSSMAGTVAASARKLNNVDRLIEQTEQLIDVLQRG